MTQKVASAVGVRCAPVVLQANYALEAVAGADATKRKNNIKIRRLDSSRISYVSSSERLLHGERVWHVTEDELVLIKGTRTDRIGRCRSGTQALALRHVRDRMKRHALAEEERQIAVARELLKKRDTDRRSEEVRATAKPDCTWTLHAHHNEHVRHPAFDFWARSTDTSSVTDL